MALPSGKVVIYVRVCHTSIALFTCPTIAWGVYYFSARYFLARRRISGFVLLSESRISCATDLLFCLATSSIARLNASVSRRLMVLFLLAISVSFRFNCWTDRRASAPVGGQTWGAHCAVRNGCGGGNRTRAYLRRVAYETTEPNQQAHLRYLAGAARSRTAQSSVYFAYQRLLAACVPDLHTLP